MLFDGFWARFHDVAVSLHKNQGQNSVSLRERQNEKQNLNDSPTGKLISLFQQYTVIQIEVDSIHVAMVTLPHLLHLGFIRHVNFFDAVQQLKQSGSSDFI